MNTRASNWSVALVVAAAGMAMTASVALGQPSGGAANALPVKYEGKGERRERLDAMQGKPFDTSLWASFSAWNGSPVTAEATKGKVVMILSWATWYTTSQAQLKTAQELADKHKGELVVVGMHGSNGWDRVKDILTARGATFPTGLDKDGSIRKALDIDQDPDFYFIDRAGNLRYADIATSSVEGVVDALVAETVEQAKAAKPPSSTDGEGASGGGGGAGSGKPADGAANGMGVLGGTVTAGGVKFDLPDKASYDKVKWPAANKARMSAQDVQGKKLLAALGKEQWLTDKPDLAGKIVVIDFWATWCGPCRAAMPELDKLYNQHKADVVIMGISDEDSGKLKKFFEKSKHDYPQATDPSSTIYNALKIQGIPHVVVISTDGVVRFQGNPHPQADLRKLQTALASMVKTDPGVLARRAAEAASPAKTE